MLFRETPKPLRVASEEWRRRGKRVEAVCFSPGGAVVAARSSPALQQAQALQSAARWPGSTGRPPEPAARLEPNTSGVWKFKGGCRERKAGKYYTVQISELLDANLIYFSEQLKNPE